MTWLNVGCGTHLAPKPWINLDFHEDDYTKPDIITTPWRPFPFPTHEADRVLLSHVLEHIKLDSLPRFFAQLRDTLAFGAEVLVIGPDIYRTLELWNAGRERFELLTSTLEHAAYPGTTDWPEALHHWNCHEERVLEMLKLEGFTCQPLMEPPRDWPHWNWSSWQFAILARLETP